MRNSIYILTAAFISIALHALFLLVLADQILIAGVELEDPLEPERRLRVHTINPRDRVFRRDIPKEQREGETRREMIEAIEKGNKIKRIFEKNELVRKPAPKLYLDGLGKNILKPKLPEPSEVVQATAPRPKLLEIDSADLNPERLSPDRPERTPKLEREEVADENLPSLLPAGTLRRGKGAVYHVGMRLGGIGSVSPLHIEDLPNSEIDEQAIDDVRQRGFGALADLPELPGIDLPGPTGGSRDSGNVSADTGESLTGRGRMSASRPDGKTVMAMDSLMSVNMTIFPERKNGGIFRIDIAPNLESDRLRAVAKDVLFLIDCSNSISARKLSQFKTATVNALPYLTRRDRFSVVSFRDRPTEFFETFVPVTDENLALAKKCVESIHRGGMTDVFAGLSPYVQAEDDQAPRSRPLNIFLMSDGKSTVKDAFENEELIREIVKLNHANTSIYSFSAGESANLFLLDFLAYNNRGMSLHEKKLKDFESILTRFISTHSSLIVSDLKYRITGGMESELFPKQLPHLYRRETLSIYGRYNENTDEIALSIVGKNAEGALEELIFRGDLTKCSKSGPELALDWAAQKAFYLIAQRTLETSKTRKMELNRQLRAVAEAYNLYIPYVSEK